MLLNNYRINLIKRYYSKSTQNNGFYSSNEIRKRFLEYFIKNDHQMIRSSPVTPFCDPSVVFVNAGMNQFKNIFLGKSKAPCPSAVNSQKCIRVGGKHNDLSIVGTDGYHHTFFEMLGNWSFGNYFKKEACEHSWNLLTGPFKIPPSALYVTYFGGDKKLNLPPDNECFEIWRSLGLPKDRIIAFDKRDNFWEMGSTGPCGPCTEIHIDHLKNATGNRSKLVNTGLSDLTELWNIVFIEYNRIANDQIEVLPQKHIDTGMGMERLCAVLQNKTNNYDTDLFTPILDRIQKVSKVTGYSRTFDNSNEMYELDVAYRIVSDHARMILSCISDGMLPNQNYKLRRILRKVLRISQRTFNHPNLLAEILPTIAIGFQDVYPEMLKHLPKTLNIIAHECELFRAVNETTSGKYRDLLEKYPELEKFDIIDLPGFLPGYKEFMNVQNTFVNNQMSGEFIFKLYDTYGLNLDVIECIGDQHGFTLDKLEFQNCLNRTIQRTKNIHYFKTIYDSNSLLAKQLAKLKETETNNKHKYTYKYNDCERVFELEPLNTKIVYIFEDDVSDQERIFHIITKDSNFYYQSGGQSGDIGQIIRSNSNSPITFNVTNVKFENGLIIHTGKYQNDKEYFTMGDAVQLIVDNEHRTGNIQHHTATHLLNSAVRSCTKNTAVFQKSSNVTVKDLKLELGILGEKLTKEIIENIEKLVRQMIKSSTPIESAIINAQQAYSMDDIILVPGEIYPEMDLRLVAIHNGDNNFLSKELCCGTHALNTIECDDFFITNVKQSGRNSYTINAVTGKQANITNAIGNDLKEDVKNMEKICIENDYKIDDELKLTIKRLKQMLFEGVHATIPYTIKLECLSILSDLHKRIKDMENVNYKNQIENEIKMICEQKENEPNEFPYLIHTSTLNDIQINDKLLFQIFKKLSKKIPIMFIHQHNQASTSSAGAAVGESSNSTAGDSQILRAICYIPATGNKNSKWKNVTAQNWLNEFMKCVNGQMFNMQTTSIDVCSMKSIKIDPNDKVQFNVKLMEAINSADDYAKKHFFLFKFNLN